MAALSQEAYAEVFLTRLRTTLSPGWTLDGLRPSEEGKRLEVATSSFGDEEALKRVPVYNSINHVLALFGWFQRTKVFQE